MQCLQTLPRNGSALKKQSANDLGWRASCGVRATTVTTARKTVVAAVVDDETRTAGHLFRTPCLQHARHTVGKSVVNILRRPPNLRPATSVIVMQQPHERVSLESCLQSTLLYVRTTPSSMHLDAGAGRTSDKLVGRRRRPAESLSSRAKRFGVRRRAGRRGLCTNYVTDEKNCHKRPNCTSCGL